MLVRSALPHERAAAAELRVRTYVDQGLVEPDSPYLPTLHALGSDGTGEVLVAVDNGEVLGTATVLPYSPHSEVAWSESESELRALAVSPQAQGKGLGRRLLAAVFDQARRFDAQSIVLSTRTNMTAAQQMYVAAGFVRLPERDWSPRAGVRLLAYRLVLPRGTSNSQR